MPSAPAPAQRSMTRVPSSSAARTLKTASLTTPWLGRTPFGVSSRRPPSCPPWIRRLPVRPIAATGSGADAYGSIAGHLADPHRRGQARLERRGVVGRDRDQQAATGLG